MMMDRQCHLFGRVGSPVIIIKYVIFNKSRYHSRSKYHTKRKMYSRDPTILRNIHSKIYNNFNCITVN